MPKKIEVKYDRNIFTQLEETLIKLEQMQAEITHIKSKTKLTNKRTKFG